MQRGTRSIVIQSPTGSGKTLLTAHMVKTAAAKGMTAWFCVHRRELVKQSIRAFAEVGVNHGVVAAGFLEAKRHAVQIASIQTLIRRYERLRRPQLIIWDECHHIAAGSWAALRKAIPEAFHIGLTATPERLDGKGLAEYFDVMIEGPSVEWLIENGYLAPYRIFAPQGISVAGVHTRMGDFAKDELLAVADKPTITGDAIKHYLKHAAGKRAVVFCVSIEHSKHVVEQFRQAGIPAVHVDGETETEARDQAIRRFTNGEVRVLSNVELFGEGFDLPSLEVAILLRPTQSLGLYLQQVGRALRPSPGKTEAIILDHAGNCERHGLPDEERQWSISGREDKTRRGANAVASVRVCPRCFAAQYPGRASCTYCGHVFEAKPRQVEHVEGDLQEVDTAALRRQRLREQSRTETFEDLVELGRARGYKRPYLWAKHVWNARQQKKLAEGRAV